MMKAEIQSALLASTGTHVGAKVPAQSRGVTQVMRGLGLIGANNGLTRAGSVQALAARRAAEDAAFS
jgi:hypothetical protein